MAADLVAILRGVVTERARQLARHGFGQLMPVIDDLVIPTALQQTGDDVVSVAFAVHARHNLLRERLALPEWLKAHRAGDHTVVAVLLACDYTLPPSWLWETQPGADDNPVTARIVMLTLRDGSGLVVVHHDQTQNERTLPPAPAAAWVHALYQCCCEYLSHTQPTMVVGLDPPRWERPPGWGRPPG